VGIAPDTAVTPFLRWSQVLPPHGGKTTFIVRAQPPRMSSLSHRCHFFWFDSFWFDQA